jgi:hypothetical protein
MRVYHGSYCKVREPSIYEGRSNTDFGLGFYVTPNLEMAEKWACRKTKAVINEYDLDTNGLTHYRFRLDSEWLNFVVSNRSDFAADYECDLLVGAIADDRLFQIIEQYEGGFLSEDVAVEALNCIKVGEQFCIKTTKGLEYLKFVKSVELSTEQVHGIRTRNREERKLANELTSEIIRRSVKDRRN